MECYEHKLTTNQGLYLLMDLCESFSSLLVTNNHIMVKILYEIIVIGH